MSDAGPLSLAIRQARLLAVRDYIDMGGGAMLFYTGSELPVTPETATTEQLLATVPLALPSGSIGMAGALAILTMAVPRIALASATGEIGWARFVNGDGHGVKDLRVGAPGSGMPVIMAKTQVYTNGEVQLVSCVFAE